MAKGREGGIHTRTHKKVGSKRILAPTTKTLLVFSSFSFSFLGGSGARVSHRRSES